MNKWNDCNRISRRRTLSSILKKVNIKNRRMIPNRRNKQYVSKLAATIFSRSIHGLMLRKNSKETHMFSMDESWILDGYC